MSSGGRKADLCILVQVMGDRFMDRIEFEVSFDVLRPARQRRELIRTSLSLVLPSQEWALKAIDPTLAPKPWTALTQGANGVKHGGNSEKVSLRRARLVCAELMLISCTTSQVELLYPKSLLASEELVASLQKQLDHREVSLLASEIRPPS